MVAILKKHQEEQNKQKEIVGDARQQPEMVFTSCTGHWYDRSLLNSQFRRFVAKYKDELQLTHNLTIHGLRHPYVKLKLKFLLTQHYRCIGAKVLDFPLNFKPVVGVNIHLVYKHICECLCQGVFLFHCFCCLQSF